ncbi:zinc finger protein 846-like isoform X2 [Cataglyphis hispanica]|uniref:zinc finger protein 846-like isoform X2 n=1 Tax=Cataglyphis hispanica TaxID=1086592 RepID=UPI00217F30F7|nr:zinc finger protein 846-like isoform X2 [Cataglyphis hispanica]
MTRVMFPKAASRPYEKNGMQKVCRLCLQPAQRDVTPLFDDVNDDECQRLRLQIADLCSIIILQNDNLPKFICCKCNIRLRDAHEFVNLCKNSNDKLHEYYEKNHCQIIKVIKEKGQKSKGREHKYAGKSLRFTRKSLKAYSEIAVSSKMYNTALSQSTLNVEINSEPDNNDESDLDFKIRETSSNEPVILNKNVRCNELSGNNKKQYLCDVCSKTFVSKSGLRLHLKSHYGIKPYTCQYCDKSFAIPSYKKRHEKIHTGDKHFVCHICSTTFASSNGLKYHLKAHTGEANYHCDTCGKSFVRYKYLKDHIFTHTGEKPYICKICDSAYGNSGSLFVHEKKCKLQRVLDSERTP